MLSLFAALLTVSVTAYTSALDQAVGAIGTAVPPLAIKALAIMAGLIVLAVGVKVIRKFAHP